MAQLPPLDRFGGKRICSWSDRVSIVGVKQTLTKKIAWLVSSTFVRWQCFSSKKPLRYMLCKQDLPALHKARSHETDDWKWLHSKRVVYRKKIWTISNGIMFWPLCPVVSVEFQVVRHRARSQSAPERTGNNSSHGIVHKEYVGCNQKVSCFSECTV